MIKDSKMLRDFEKRMIREDNDDIDKKLALYEAMYEYSLKMLAQRGFKIDPLEGIDIKIKIAKVIDSV